MKATELIGGEKRIEERAYGCKVHTDDTKLIYLFFVYKKGKTDYRRNN